MKRYVKASKMGGNGNAVAIATEVFGDWFRQNKHIRIYKQRRGYALKYYTQNQSDARNTLGSMYKIADELQIPVIDSGLSTGYLSEGGVMDYLVAYIVVPAL